MSNHRRVICFLVAAIVASWTLCFKLVSEPDTAAVYHHHVVSPSPSTSQPSWDVGGMELVGEYHVESHVAELWFDERKCSGVLMVGVGSKRDCAAAEEVVISNDVGTGRYLKAKVGPEHHRLVLRGPEVVLGGVVYKGGCTYHNTFKLTKKGSYTLHAEAVFTHYNAVNEITEKVWYDYAQTPLLPGFPVVSCHRGDADVNTSDDNSTLCPLKTQSESPGRWVDVGPDPSDFKKSYPSYWLNIGKHEVKSLSPYTPDLLGRMDFKRTYQWVPYSCRHRGYSKNDVLELLRGKAVYFFGDSHMRTAFYGLLSRLGVKYAPDKVWKGDRVDVIKSHNATVGYVASYFLNTSRPTAVEVLKKSGDGVTVVAGVGQHHASGCWSLRKHAATVEAAMRDFDKYNTSVVWFGIPAHPMNRHMRVSQHRTDCRNNLRHDLMNTAQYQLARSHGYPIVDTFAKSVSMIHTSPDGAHYYTWVRDAWIDDIFASYELLHSSS